MILFMKTDSKHDLRKQTFLISGMSCASCASNINKTLKKQAGVYNVNINYAAASATIEFDGKINSTEHLVESVKKIGYDLFLDLGDDTESESERIRNRNYSSLKKRTLWAVILSVPISVIAMGFHTWIYAGLVTWLLSTPVVFFLGRTFFKNAWTQLRHGTSNMDTLVAVSTGVSYLFSLFNLFYPDFWTSRGLTPHLYFETAAMIITFILLGRTLEERAKGKTSEAIRELMDLQPKLATVIRDGKETSIGIHSIYKGDTIVVKPGERIAVDGTVVDGSSHVDESMLSGEPLAVYKQHGDKVFAGTINQKGSFQYTAEAVGGNTLLSQIIRMVKDAQGSKAPVQKQVDRIASVFVPIIILLSVITLVLWLFLDSHNGLTHGIMSSVTVLIIACPCALGLATPTAIMVGMGRGARKGILIKDAESLETARKIDILVLDKTGTITEGKPVVSNIVWVDGNKNKKNVFYAMEKKSEHPLAGALADELQNDNETVPLILEEFKTVTGQGIVALHSGNKYMVGNLFMMNDKNINIPDSLSIHAKKWYDEAKTVVWFACDNNAVGVAAVTDRIKQTSIEAVSRLREMGIRVVMITGDNRQSASAVAEQVNISSFIAEALPHQKAEWVKKYQEEGYKVAVAGDGINDSAALAQADLSIAMGQGSDIAKNVAQITIMSSDLIKISEAVRLSVDTVRTIRQNLFWAFIYNLIGIPLAAGLFYPINGFLLDPMIAGAAMAMSSVSVVTNSLRLRGKKKNTISATLSDSWVGNTSDKYDMVCKNVSGESCPISDENTDKPYHIRKRYLIEGMMCNHCRMKIEKTINMLPGVKAVVTLDPPVATLRYLSENDIIPIEKLRLHISDNAGEYSIIEM